MTTAELLSMADKHVTFARENPDHPHLMDHVNHAINYLRAIEKS